MKPLSRFLSLFLTAVMLFSMFACGKTEPQKTDNTTASLTEKPATDGTSEKPNTELPPVTTEPKVTEPVVTEPPVVTEDPNAPKAPEVLYNKYKDYNNAFILTGEELGIPQTEDYLAGIAAADMKDGLLVIVYSQITEYWDDFSGKNELTVISFDTLRGKKSGEIKIDGTFCELCILDSGEIAVGYKRQPDKTYVPNENFELAIYNTDLTESTVTKGIKCNAINILRDGTALIKEYVQGQEYQNCRLADVHSLDKPTIEFEAGTPILSIVKNDGDSLLLVVVGRDATQAGARYYKDTGKIEYIANSTYPFVNNSDCLCYDVLTNGWFVNNINSDKYIFIKNPTNGDFPSRGNIDFGNSKYFVLTDSHERYVGVEIYIDTDYYIYNSENGKFISKLVCDDIYVSKMHALDKDNTAVLFLESIVDGKYCFDLVLWYAGTEDKSEGALNIEILEDGKIEEDIARISANLEEKLPIRICYDKDALSNVDSVGYKFTYVEDRKAVLKMILSLVSCAEEYPEGFFNDIRKKKENPLEIYFSDKITGTNSVSSSVASALTSERVGYFYICFDVNEYYQLRRTFAHELMHVIDRVVTDYCFDTNDFRLYHYWTAKLNDGPYDYNYGYNDKNGNAYMNTDGTVFGKGEAYYVKAYSKTYPEEDKATVFENLYEKSNYYFDEGTPLTRKAEFLIALIRYILPSVGKLETECSWEEYLGIHTLDEFDVFKD